MPTLHDLFGASLHRPTVLCLVALFGCAPQVRNSPGSPAERPPASCGLTVAVTGALFSPRECAFQVVISGVPCGPNTACPPQYTISLKDPEPSHLRQVVLMNFQSLRNGVHSARPSPGQREFDGFLIDSTNAHRSLLHGEVTLQQVAEAEALNVTFDLVFARTIGVRGDGFLPIKEVYAP